MTQGYRIKSARTAKGLSQGDVAAKLRVTRNAVSQWEHNKSTPKSKTLDKLAVILGRSKQWIESGRELHFPIVEGLRLQGTVAAGVWLEAQESQDSEVERVPVAPDQRYPADAQYALRVVGNSVDKVAADGSVVTCVDVQESGIDVRPGDLVWVERRRGGLVESTVKRLRKGTNGLELWPESNDPLHQEKLSVGAREADTEVLIRGLVIHVLTPVPRGA